ncbi:glycoside hydrolase family 30 protein [Apiospora arundinis]
MLGLPPTIPGIISTTAAMSRRCLLSLLLSANLCGRGAADTTTTVNPSTNWGTWEGWGTSLAWWAAAFGDRDDLADLFFSTKSVNFGGKTVPGLGFNIARYNAGASSKNSVNGESMVVSPKMILSRQVEGFWTDWTSADPASSSWNWNADANQRSMLTKARDRGADIFELFSNSPMWWMCTNHNPAGADNGGNDNLQSWNYQQFAVYMAEIAKHANDKWNIKFQSVEPFNEPMASWWSGKTGTQEGCHFGTSTQATLVKNLRTELDSRGLSSAVIAASDENSYDQAISTWNALAGAGVAGSIARVNVHGYQYGGGKRDVLYSTVNRAGKKLWQSEYGKADDTGSDLASNLLLDFRWLHPTAWVYWQVIDGGGWGLVDGNNDAKTLGAVSQKYYVLAQYSRHIKPGMQILDGGNDSTIVAYDAGAKKLVVVAVNWGNTQNLSFDLSKFKTPGTEGSPVPRWSTQIGSGEQYVAHSDTTLKGGKFQASFNKNQVQTFEISGVVI